jgi:hypothetical protein
MRNDEDKLQGLREERMSALLCNDVTDEEYAWVEYEDEEAQIKFDLADVLFDVILDETLNLLTMN